MSDGSEITEVPGPQEAPPKPSLMDRYRGSPTWVKVAIPVVVIAVLVGVVVVIANAVGDDSSSTTPEAASSSTTAAGSSGNTATLILVATASQLAGEETSTTTTPETSSTTTPETSTTEPTTAPPVSSSGSTTVPVTSTTTAATTTTAKATTTTAKASTTTTSGPTTSTSLVQLPAGQVAESVEAFKTAWNSAAQGSGVSEVSSWTQQPLAGHTGSAADLGGNLRLVLFSDGPNGAVAEAILAWLPLVDPADQATQNDAYQESFGVLMKTVDASVTSVQQTKVAKQLGLTSTAPPFPDGATGSATQAPAQYDLRALTPEGRTGVYTLIGATESS